MWVYHHKMEYAKTLSPKELLTYINKLKKDYYYGRPRVSDDEYDTIVELLPAGMKPKTGISVPAGYKDKTRLPYWMSSLDKAKSGTGIIERFAEKRRCGGYVVMDKLDGLSGLLVVGNSTRLYTRGSGDEGRDVSYLLDYLSVPKLSPGVYRGELIISKANFTRYRAANPEAKNARTTAVGLVNHKSPDRARLKYIDFVPYETIGADPQPRPYEQLKRLRRDGRCVWFQGLTSLSDQALTDLTHQRIKESKYDIDGLVVICDDPYTRADQDDPDYAIAFKIVKDGQDTRVHRVAWKISKDGYLKPTVIFDPIFIDGVEIKRATAHNAAFVKENCIGAGAIIKVTRSNDVIPYVLGVVKGTEPDMPECEWAWNETRKDAVTVGSTKDEHLQTLVYFFKEIGCQFFGEKMIERCVTVGHMTITDLIDCTIEDFMQAEGIEQKMATRIYNNIREALQKCGEAALMSASNEFGRTMGKKRIQLFLDRYPDWDTAAPTLEGLLSIEGYSNKSAYLVLDGLPEFKKFLSNLPPPYNRITFYRRDTIAAPPPKKDGQMTGQKVVVTGFRSKELENWIVRERGELTSAVSKKTTLLLTKELTESTKTQKARDYGIPVELVKDFCKKYNIK